MCHVLAFIAELQLQYAFESAILIASLEQRPSAGDDSTESLRLAAVCLLAGTQYSKCAA